MSEIEPLAMPISAPHRAAGATGGAGGASGASGEHAATRPLLELQALSLRFGGLRVLHDVNLQVGRSEVVALIGPNGAGKSALLNCVSGVYRPQRESRILLDGQRIDTLGAHRVAAAGVARTFQGLHLAAGLSVRDNILLGLAARDGVGAARALLRPLSQWRRERAAREAVETIAAQCRLDDVLARPVGDLPLGVLRRVDLARALIGQPRLLLLDEPASGLSHDERPLIGEMVRLARAQAGLSVLWIEHDLELVLNEASRAVVLHHGELVESGDPRVATERARIITGYKHGRQLAA
ncbi:ABC transporter ATP-binding protein [Chitinasiproducens palmae]|uniref:Branched-chain amino acid transport system ATP-binding protein n=1 Tax=Chitinasiproducens palmae TaxID=1770053 RepID=A0A1H2PQ52_9BURK|nr:ATP-binding cassette domain-containing protein [Chitinasiproducens palmae]SDV48949.1 branched-chain amino acid transport system ATP-binding protein [Chitinasiproducens palmae]